MNGYSIGQMVRLRPSITKRPDYFNQSGHMDWMLNGAAFQIDSFDTEGRRRYIVVQDAKNYWHVLIEDIVPLMIDNRRIANV